MSENDLSADVENRSPRHDDWITFRHFADVDRGRARSQGEAWSNASNTPFRLHKRWVHEGGIATPLIAHWPAKIQATGALSHQPGHVVDIMATCLDVADAHYPEVHNGNPIKPAPGISLLPWLTDPDQNLDRTLYWEHEKHAAIRQGDWKLVSLNGRNKTAWELYDMSNDRTETKNVAQEHPDRVARLKTLWTEWARDVNVLPWPQDR